MASNLETSAIGIPTIPPAFCKYSDGPCDQNFDDIVPSDILILYPSQPEFISTTIEEAVRKYRNSHPSTVMLTWRDIDIPGQIIFCRICKALRFTKIVFADVTTLNFNLLFEIGYAIGLGVPVIPLRDTTLIKDNKIFDELGLIDTLGYINFQNSDDIVKHLDTIKKKEPIIFNIPSINKEQPLYLIKSHIHNEGMVKLFSSIKKSGLYFRNFDPKETTRLSIHEAVKQVFSSLGVLVHLTSPDRAGSITHNSRCAFVAGIAMAAGKHILMLQEGDVLQPIDYREIVRSYTNAAKIQELLIPFYKSVVETLQESRFVAISLPLRILEKVDLGDLAAENEIKALNSYFVPTSQYNEVKRGHARLVIGRKGAGKSAIFYGIRSTFKPSNSNLVLDLKPEGHQFIKLREAVLNKLTAGLQQHVLTAFWHYLILMELAHKIVYSEKKIASRDRRLWDAYVRVEKAYGATQDVEQGDFSERLLNLVDDIVRRGSSIPSISGTPQVTELIYKQDVSALNDALADYLSAKESVWLLFDNLDKGWPVHTASATDILILRSLLEATRKVQRQLEGRGVEFKSVVFIRNDIYEHLLKETPDKGKDTVVVLDWSDPEVFKELLRRRIELSTDLESLTFDDLWAHFFDTHVKGEDSFLFILNRTLMRPREVIRFTKECVDIAVNRGHEKVTESDILQAEKLYSDDALQDVIAELKDISEKHSDMVYGFISCKEILSQAEIEAILTDVGAKQEELKEFIGLLIWFGFVGVRSDGDEERYAYRFQHNLIKMYFGVEKPFTYVIHPAFRSALGCIPLS